MSEQPADKTDQWTRKIQKLLALAQGNTNPAEAGLAMKRALEMIAKYGIDMAKLQNTDRAADDTTGNKIIRVPGVFSKEKARILYVILTMYRATGLLLRATDMEIIDGKYTGEWAVHAFGYASDIHRAEMIFTVIISQMTSDLLAARPDGMGRGVQMKWSRSFILGFGVRILKRIQLIESRAKTDAEAESGSMDIVLYDRKNTADSLLSDTYPETKELAPAAPAADTWAFHEGDRSGQRADLGQTRFSQGRSQLGS